MKAKQSRLVLAGGVLSAMIVGLYVYGYISEKDLIHELDLINEEANIRRQDDQIKRSKLREAARLEDEASIPLVEVHRMQERIRPIIEQIRSELKVRGLRESDYFVQIVNYKASIVSITLRYGQHQSDFEVFGDQCSRCLQVDYDLTSHLLSFHGIR